MSVLNISDATGTSRFTTIDITDDLRIRMTETSNLIGDGEVKTLLLQGVFIGLGQDVLTNVKAVCIRQVDFANGAPWQTFPSATYSEGERMAASLNSGELVTLAATFADSVQRTESGVMVSNFQIQNAALGQSMTITFYPCDSLFINYGSASQAKLEVA